MPSPADLAARKPPYRTIIEYRDNTHSRLTVTPRRFVLRIAEVDRGHADTIRQLAEQVQHHYDGAIQQSHRGKFYPNRDGIRIFMSSASGEGDRWFGTPGSRKPRRGK